MKSDNWYDWKWQVNNSIIDQNQDYFFPMKVTPYYYNLIDNDGDCPIKKQAIPTEYESINIDDYANFGVDVNDSLCEEKQMPVPNLVHRYKDRVLLLVTNNCFMFCRFCTRKRVTGSSCGKNNISEAIKYIEKHTEIKDVLISGGDPFTLSDEEIDGILKQLRRIKHLKIIRIGTRAPVVLPMRITENLISIINKYKPIWINTHFNHPKELTQEAIEACSKFIDSGIPLGNQTVLLKNINDDAEIMKKLCLKLIANRIRPYYLYQCDIGKGLDHFRTKIQTGIDIINQLRFSVSGFAIPLYVIDAPNGGGKFPIMDNYIVERTDKKIVLGKGDGQVFTYPEVIEE